MTHEVCDELMNPREMRWKKDRISEDILRKGGTQSESPRESSCHADP